MKIGLILLVIYMNKKFSQLDGGMSNTPLQSANNIINLPFNKVVDEKTGIPFVNSINENNKCVAIIDYVSYTFDFYQPLIKKGYRIENYTNSMLVTEYNYLQELINILGYSNIDEQTYVEYLGSWKGGCLTLGENIKIFFGGPLKSNGRYTNKLEMSGHACRDFESKSGIYEKLFKFFLNNKHYGSPTRVDGTEDIFSNKYFTLDLMEDYLNKGLFVGKFKSFKRDLEKNKNGITKDIIYLGKIDSDICGCWYDKKLEKMTRDEDEIYEYHYRCEIRYKKSRALFFVKQYLNMCDRQNNVNTLMDPFDNESKSLGELLSKLIYDFVDFKDPEQERTEIKKRCTVKWWLDFLDLARKSTFCYDEKQATLYSNAKYLETSIFKIIDKVYLYYLMKDSEDSFKEWFFNCMYSKFLEFTNVEFSIVRNYIEKETGEIISNKDFINKIKKKGFDYENSKVFKL